MLSEGNIRRNRRLAGICEGIRLNAPTGRSDHGSLGWYIEEYLLALVSQLVTSLDNASMVRGINLAISESGTRINENVLVAKLIIQNNSKEIMLTATVNMEQAASTVVTTTRGGVTDKYSLASKHTKGDKDAFIENITSNLLNAMNTTEEK